jgi:hypothetical protein
MPNFPVEQMLAAGPEIEMHRDFRHKCMVLGEIGIGVGAIQQASSFNRQLGKENEETYQNKRGISSRVDKETVLLKSY